MKNLKHVNTCKYLYNLTRDEMYRTTEHITANFENEPFAHYISTYTDDIRQQLNDEIIVDLIIN